MTNTFSSDKHIQTKRILSLTTLPVMLHRICFAKDIFKRTTLKRTIINITFLHIGLQLQTLHLNVHEKHQVKVLLCHRCKH